MEGIVLLRRGGRAAGGDEQRQGQERPKDLFHRVLLFQKDGMPGRMARHTLLYRVFRVL